MTGSTNEDEESLAFYFVMSLLMGLMGVFAIILVLAVVAMFGYEAPVGPWLLLLAPGFAVIVLIYEIVNRATATQTSQSRTTIPAGAATPRFTGIVRSDIEALVISFPWGLLAGSIAIAIAYIIGHESVEGGSVAAGVDAMKSWGLGAFGLGWSLAFLEEAILRFPARTGYPMKARLVGAGVLGLPVSIFVSLVLAAFYAVLAILFAIVALAILTGIVVAYAAMAGFGMLVLWAFWPSRD